MSSSVKRQVIQRLHDMKFNDTDIRSAITECGYNTKTCADWIVNQNCKQNKNQRLFVGMKVWIFSFDDNDWYRGNVASIRKELISIIFNGHDFRWLEKESHLYKIQDNKPIIISSIPKYNYNGNNNNNIINGLGDTDEIIDDQYTQPKQDETDYFVTFTESVLGLELYSDEHGFNCIIGRCVSTIAKQKVTPGSQIVQVNNKWLANYKFEDIRDAVKQATTQPPLVITFRINTNLLRPNKLQQNQFPYGCTTSPETGNIYDNKSEHSTNNEVIDYIITLEFNECNKLKIGDNIDHRDDVGRFLLATIIDKDEYKVKIHYNGWNNEWDIWCNYKLETHRFALPRSISKKPNTRFKDLKIRDYVDINPIQKQIGWRVGQIRRMDKYSGQAQIVYKHNGQEFLYWTHLDNSQEIAPFMTKAAETITLQQKIAEFEHIENECIGLSIGGAKDINHFRQCIEQNIMPSIDSITFNGLLSEYYFETTNKQNNDNDSMLFYPTYCYAKTQILNSNINEYEYWMSVGLNSNIKMNKFKRNNLNLVILLDKSGSMNNSFKYGEIQTKMTVANQSIINLLKHLRNNDRFALITFDNNAQILQDLKFINNININDLTQIILNIKANGGTNFECGYNKIIDVYEKLFKHNKYNNYDNRIILLTDAQPNIGIINKKSLLNMVKTYAENNEYKNQIYTTFIGIGMDFNSSLIETISQTRGCNYFSVKSIEEFNNKMNNEFEYMVTPLVFNIVLKLKCEGNGCKIDKVYGSNDKQIEKILETGEISYINTLFAAKKQLINGKGNGIKGGIQIIKLKKLNNGINDIENMNVEIQVLYEDKNGKTYKNIQNVRFVAPKLINDMIENDEKEYNNNNFYDNIGIEKGILLCKYVELIVEWIKSINNVKILAINDKYKKLFIHFLKYFKSEMKICNDNNLNKEIKIMEKLIHLNN